MLLARCSSWKRIFFCCIAEEYGLVMICGWLPILKIKLWSSGDGRGWLRKAVAGELGIRQHRLILAVENQSPSRICQTCHRHTNAASAYPPMMLSSLLLSSLFSSLLLSSLVFSLRAFVLCARLRVRIRVCALIETRTAIRTAVSLARFIHSQ